MVVRTRRRRVDRGEIWYILIFSSDAGWSSPVARWAHNPKVAGSNPAPATKFIRGASPLGLPYTLSRSALRRLAPFVWLVRCAHSRGLGVSHSDSQPSL